jgi:hypothetical protein
MANTIRKNVDAELKDLHSILDSNPTGWTAIHAALEWAEAQLQKRPSELLAVAREAVESVHAAGFQSSPDRRMTRFSGFKDIMAWQDALYVVNSHPDWRFSDEVLCVGWLVELGGAEMGRGPARASYWKDSSLYVGGTRALYNNGKHGNGPGWPTSLAYRGGSSRR